MLIGDGVQLLAWDLGVRLVVLFYTRFACFLLLVIYTDVWFHGRQ